MEYLKGETLAERLAKGPLPLDQGLRYAIQIADALAKAHGARIVHRDLKPGNIMLTTSGATLLDFGLAKPARPALVTDLSPPPPTPPVTERGTILGTIQYMAPEQLEGREADARTDIFAYGAVVYEMLTGRKAFEGKSHVSVIAAIMQAEPPPMSASQPFTPPLLDHLVKTCLAKDPNERWQSAADVMRQLTWIAGAGASSALAATQPKRRVSLGWIIVAASTLAALAAVIGYRYVAPREIPPVRFAVSPPETTTFPNSTAFFAMSPDGLSLAFTATDASGKTSLWIRPLDSVTARSFPGTDGASSPFWSPDGRVVAFYAQGKLKRVNISDGSLQDICDVSGPGITGGGAWSRNGVILFEMGGGPLYRVSPSGGTPTPVTTLDPSRSEQRHMWPSFLPDSRHFLYSANTRTEGGGVYVAALDSKEVRPLINAQSNALYTSGYLLFGIRGAVMAQPFDARYLQLAGEPFRITEQVLFDPLSWRTAFSASETGALAYRGGASYRTSQLTWFDRTGKPLVSIGDRGQHGSVNLSPDGTKIAVDRLDPRTGEYDIWLMDVSRGTNSRFTTHPGSENVPDMVPGWRTYRVCVNTR
jgi:Tol biopolymer transport system component